MGYNPTMAPGRGASAGRARAFASASRAKSTRKIKEQASHQNDAHGGAAEYGAPEVKSTANQQNG